MSARLLSLLVLGMVIVACSPGGTGPTVPGVPTNAPTVPGGPDSTPGGAPTAAPGGGDLESLARALVPPGSAEVSAVPAGGSFTVIATTPMTLDQLKAFYAQAIPATGVSFTGPLEVAGTLTYALTNPDGGVVVTPGGDQGFLITISVGQT